MVLKPSGKWEMIWKSPDSFDCKIGVLGHLLLSSDQSSSLEVVLVLLESFCSFPGVVEQKVSDGLDGHHWSSVF